MEPGRRLHGDLARLHELLRDADGGSARCDGREEISRADAQERQASGLDRQDQARSRRARHPGGLEKAAPDFRELDVGPVS